MLRSQSVLLALLALTFTLNLSLNVVNVRAPVFMTTSGAGAGGYALFEAFVSGGALAGILLVGLISRRVSLDAQVGVAVALLALGVAALALPLPAAWFAGAALAGLGLGIGDVAAITRVQLLVPGHLRGRVAGAMISVTALGLSLGAVLGGTALSGAALMPTLGAVLALLALGWALLARRASMKPSFAT